MTKNFKTAFIPLTLMFSLLIGVNNSSAANLATTLKGKILLQVEQHGEAWYVNPTNMLRYYLGRPTDAFNVMKELGLGISNKDFDSFNGYAPSGLSGRILLKVEDNGRAYYVNPGDLKMYYLGRPADAFSIMRELGLGINDKNLDLIGIVDPLGWKSYHNNKYGVYFSYPQNFQIITDKIQVEYIGNPKGFNWYRIELTDASLPEKPFLRFEIDPDGYGPFFPDKTYQIGESKSGKILINSVSNSSSENSNDGQILIIPNALKASNEHSYSWQFSFNESGKDYEPLFKQILTTFQFTGSANRLFEKAVNKSDFSTASKYFADNVYVALEGSSCCGEVAASRAKQELERINGLIFTFNSNDAVVKEYMAYVASQYPDRRLIKNSPKLYFDEYIIGVESDVSQQNKVAIGYKISNDKITDLFIDVGRDR